jgi:folate-binding protein YgfZ
MADLFYIPLAHRSLFSLAGEDRRTFLQGLVSNDVAKAAPDRTLYGAFLTPQGKFLHEFFLGEKDDAFWLETETGRRDDFVRRLSIYKLRSKVGMATTDGVRVFALLGRDPAAAIGLPGEAGAAGPFGGGVVFVDPRLPAAGLRGWLPEGAEAALAGAGFERAEPPYWDAHRIRLGLPDGSRDLVPEKAILLENGFNELHGVDWEKGCYLGQELTARTKYRGLVRKRLVPVAIAGPAPEPGTQIMLGDAAAGEMRSHSGSAGLAMLRLESLEQIAKEGGELRAGPAQLTPHLPDWIEL